MTENPSCENENSVTGNAGKKASKTGWRIRSAKWMYHHLLSPSQKKFFWKNMGRDNGTPYHDVWWDEAFYFLTALLQDDKPAVVSVLRRFKPIRASWSSGTGFMARKKFILLRYCVRGVDLRGNKRERCSARIAAEHYKKRSEAA